MYSTRRRRLARILAFALAVALTIAACGGGRGAPAAATPRPGSAERPIILAAVPFADAARLTAGVTTIAAALEQATGLKWKVNIPTSYAATIEGMCAGQIDIAFLAPLAYALAADKGCADVMLASLFGQSATYNGQILVRADSGITDVKGLRGKRFAFVDPLSASGTLYPSLLVRQQGGEDPKTFFKEMIFAGGQAAHHGHRQDARYPERQRLRATRDPGRDPRSDHGGAHRLRRDRRWEEDAQGHFRHRRVSRRRQRLLRVRA